MTMAHMGRPARAALIALAVIAVVGLILYSVYNHLNHRDIPVDYANDEQHFKYGSIGSDTNGIPYWIWKAMPEVCSDKLPGGYVGLGLVQEEGMDRPIGVSKRTTGLFDRVGPNCAFCHTATVRAKPDDKAHYYLAATSHQFDILGYFQFLFDCARDPRFNADNTMAAIAKLTTLGFLDRQIYRRAVEPTKQAITALADKLEWIKKRPAWGPGRVDTFNPYKSLVFNLDMSHDPSIGTADFLVIWNQKVREKLPVHWDGNNTSVDERNYSAALGAGATPESIDLPRINRVRQWIWDLQPPAYPFPIDTDRLKQGAALYQQYCSACHDPGGARNGKVETLKDIGTDPERANSFDAAMAERMNTIGSKYSWKFSHFSATGGYVNQILKGVWLSAPYLHNGSVPTLRELLEPPEKRSAVFYKGYDVYDQVKVGYVSNVPEERAKKFFKFDTSLPGNGNKGHSYGTELPDADKDAIVEFLKTR